MTRCEKNKLIKEYSEKFGYSKEQCEFIFDCYGASEMAWAICLDEPIQDANEYFNKALEERK